ncbi:MAG: PASTA domain-containing protein [Deltaproteobacteria bacterium]|nr:PASTA domain-containing protein [Deltaproteobacteria bacterium]
MNILRFLKMTALFLLFLFAAGISAYLSLTFVIKSEDTVVVPELKGKDLVYSLEMLTDMGLNTKVKGSEYSSTVPKNHIIFQDPEPGAKIKKDRDVRIIISKGTKTIIMPRLTGLPVQQAKIIIEENDLLSSIESYTFHPKFKKDEVITHFPLNGSEIKRNTPIDLLLSLGVRPDAYIMPDMKGTSLNNAILLLEKYNLLTGQVTSVFHKHKPDNMIVLQNPRAGDRVLEGSSVDLVISRRHDRVDTSFLKGETGIRLFRYRLENGFLRKRIRINVNCFGMQNDFFNELVKPGKEIWVLIPRFTDATVLLYEEETLVKTIVFD